MNCPWNVRNWKKDIPMALKSFAERVCDEQRALCEQGFWQAPCGKEAEYISSAPVPDLVTDVKQYKTICRWWEKLSDTRRLKVAAMFANELGPIYGHDTETLERIYSRWFLLSLDGKQTHLPFHGPQTKNRLHYAIQKLGNNHQRDTI